MIAPTELLTLVLASKRDEEDILFIAFAIASFAFSIGALVGGVMLVRRKKVGPAVGLFILAALGLLTCLGISALLFIAQFAWH